MTQFNKAHLTIDDQIQLLQKRGLKIEDHDRARHYLSNISYYRLIPYQRDFQNNSNGTHYFLENTSFEKILNIYLFDRELRLLLFDMIERLEVAFRTQLSYHYSIQKVSEETKRIWWYENSQNFISEKNFTQNLSTIDSEIKRASKELIIKHYNSSYSDPKRPPSWITFEVISLGLLSKIFRSLKPSSTKKNIAKHFKLYSPDTLESWMHTLTYIRNICAHHGRLWNRKIKIRPQQLTNPMDNIWIKNGEVDMGKLYLSLCCGLYLLRVINPRTHFTQKLKAIIEKYPDIDLNYMGFPDNWKEEEFWQDN